MKKLTEVIKEIGKYNKENTSIVVECIEEIEWSGIEYWCAGEYSNIGEIDLILEVNPEAEESKNTYTFIGGILELLNILLKDTKEVLEIRDTFGLKTREINLKEWIEYAKER